MITSQNINTVLPQLSHSQATTAAIQNAVNAGREVTISQARVTHGGWAGAGSYFIEGGANGAALAVFGASVFGVIGLFLAANAIGPLILAAILISVAIHVAIVALSILINAIA